MANLKITELAELAGSSTSANTLVIVDDPGGTPETKNISLTNLIPTGSARIRISTASTISNALRTTLVFDKTEYDSGGYVSSASGELDRLTAPATGTYYVAMTAEFAADADGWRVCELVKTFADGGTSPIARDASEFSGSANTTFVSTQTIVELSATDFVTARVHHTGGGNLNVLASSALPSFTIIRLG